MFFVEYEDPTTGLAIYAFTHRKHMQEFVDLVGKDKTHEISSDTVETLIPANKGYKYLLRNIKYYKVLPYSTEEFWRHSRIQERIRKN